jgi:signal transduction histidine kinase
MSDATLPSQGREHHADDVFLARVDTAIRMGRMLAHRLNNPIGAISGVAQLMHRRVPAGESALADYVVMIQGEVGRCSAVTEELRGLWERGTAQRAPLALDEALNVARQQALLRAHGNSAGTEPASVARTPPEVIVEETRLIVHGDSRLLSEAVTDLLLNSIEAGARIIRVSATPDPARVGGPGWVRLDITDDGEGLGTEVEQRCVEPFYSTRRGHSGMGMTNALLTARDHAGYLLLGPGIGGCGATVTMVLHTPMEVIP